MKYLQERLMTNEQINNKKRSNNNYETHKTLQTNYGVNAHTRLGRG